MTARVLPVEEWPRLATTTAAAVWPTMNPRFAEAIVVEQDGEIVGSVLLLSVLHAECAMNRGGAGVGRALMTALRERVAACGGSAVWAAALEEPMRSLMLERAEPVPGDHFILPMGGD